MKWIHRHIEWMVFGLGLLLLAFMDTGTTAPSFCLFDAAGITYCPGEGLGHSIAYTFQGSWREALEAHFMGPIAVGILSLRILYIWKTILFDNSKAYEEN